MHDYTDYSLFRHNTFGIDVKAAHFIDVETETELSGVLAALTKDEKAKILVIGGGSNLLFTKDYPGIVLHLSIKGYETVCEDRESITIRVGAGVIWDHLVNDCVEKGWYGTENLSLIPGEVGASAVQNIGAYGVEVKDLIESVQAIEIQTGKSRVFTNKECCYSYRQSIFKNELKGEYIVTHVTYRLLKNFTPLIGYGAISSALDKRGKKQITPHDLRSVIIDIRKSKLPDPEVLGNAGSFFMNPVVERSTFDHLNQIYPNIPHYDMGDKIKIPAGWLIEQCGWKGKIQGKVGVYEKQALVLVNYGGATAKDIMDLSNTICQDVKDKFGVEIHPEVNWI